MRRLCFHSLCSSAVTPELKCIFWVAYVKVVSLLASLAIACKFSSCREGKLSGFINKRVGYISSRNDIHTLDTV